MKVNNKKSMRSILPHRFFPLISAWNAVCRAGCSAPALQNKHLLQDVISCFKSRSVKAINKKYMYGKVFQTSFYEHVIADQNDWSNTWDYIDNNPRTWKTDELYN